MQTHCTWEMLMLLTVVSLLVSMPRSPQSQVQVSPIYLASVVAPSIINHCYSPIIEAFPSFSCSVPCTCDVRSLTVLVAFKARANQSQASISWLYKQAELSQAPLLNELSWISQAGQNTGFRKASASALAQAKFKSDALSLSKSPVQTLQRYTCRGTKHKSINMWMAANLPLWNYTIYTKQLKL